MRKNHIPIAVLLISITLFFTACSSPQLEVESTEEPTDQTEATVEIVTMAPTVEVVQPTAKLEEPSSIETTQRHMFEGLGISLGIPKELYVRKDPQVKFEDQSKLESYLFYIQNYGYPGGPSSGDFQMYGLLQYNLPPISWEQFSDNQINSTMNAYANYIEVGGLRGYDTQVAGERNRFVYHFYMDGQVLSIAVSQPTPENKAVADQIINSLELLPGGLSDDSHMILVSDPNQLYQILIPDDWEYNFHPPVNIQLSGLEVRSADIEAESKYEGGPHENVYYKSGVFMQLHVMEDDSANNPPFPNRIRGKYDVMYNGIEGTEYIFTQPSTVEGEERQLQMYYEGKSYMLGFAYANDTYRDVIDRIITSFNITPETFYPTQ
jgi:hypothetical protein